MRITVSKRDLKLIAATLTIIGAILSTLDRIYAPDYLLLESSPEYPNLFPGKKLQDKDKHKDTGNNVVSKEDNE